MAGTGAAAALGAANPVRAVLALMVALLMQVGVNYANDYSDGVRGTDDQRLGPFRLTGSGAARPGEVRAAALISLTAAAAVGLALVSLSGSWWLIGVGTSCIVAAWYYTGGKHPYGYAGLGEVFVFVFFGLVAVLGTTFTQAGRMSWATLAAAVGIGALACAILVANNLRDLPTDAVTGKRTLAVRFGDGWTRWLYAGLLTVAALGAVLAGFQRPGAPLALVSALAAVRPLRAVLGGAVGRELLPVLADTGRLELFYALLLAVGLAV
jgi:1,4-dihydroxy-2-naphthoate octaprenyltransferase